MRETEDGEESCETQTWGHDPVLALMRAQQPLGVCEALYRIESVSILA